jgi:hypothetical protein
VTLTAIAALVVACGGLVPSTPTPSPSPSASGIALRTRADTGACAGVGLDAEVHGDPADPSVVC